MTEVTVRIKAVRPGVVPPAYMTEGAAGFDLCAAEDVVIAPGQTVLIPTGLAFEIPPGYELQIRPRSGLTLRTKLRVHFGTVDRDFRGDVGVIAEGTCVIRKGDRIAQGVIAPVARASFIVADALTDTERGAGGFGSTGRSTQYTNEGGDAL